MATIDLSDNLVDDFIDNSSGVFLGFMTSDECIAMCEHQNKEDYLFYGSLAVNALLLVTTTSQNYVPASAATGVLMASFC